MSGQIHVIVLGAGYAGLMAAMRLARKTDSGIAITLVSAEGTFNERVRNHQLAAGEPVRRHSLADLLRRTRIQFLQGSVESLDPSQQRVTVRAPTGVRTLAYDYLVYALGSFVKTDGVPGARQYAYTLDYTSTLALAERLPALAASGGRLLVVGGGNTGVEVVTEIAERYPGLHVTLVTRHSLARNLSAGARAYIRRAFDRLGIQFVEHTDVVELSEREALTTGGQRLPFDACVWVGGFAVSDLARRSGLRVNERGQVLIDRAMRSLSHPNVYAVGDAAFPIRDPGAPIRMSLYTAIMMGAHGADSLAARLRGKSPTAFGLSYVALGLSLGRRDGVFQFLDLHHDTPLNRIVTGKLANGMREFFVRFALLAIRMQRVAPWVFSWPGRRKMRGVPVDEPSLVGQTTETAEAAEPTPVGSIPARPEAVARSGR